MFATSLPKPSRTAMWACVTALISAYIVLLPAADALAAGPAITVQKNGPGSVLAGETAEYTLTATNPNQVGAVPEYNLSFTDVLPPGASYVGPTTPAGFPDPVTSTGPGGVVVLTWSGVSDLAVGESVSIGFNVDLGPDGDVVGNTVNDGGYASASTEPRDLPRFNPDGTPIAGPTIQSAGPASAATTISALKVEKSEPSPEGELLRGVHDQRTVYTLRVTNTGIAATNGVTLTDYLPAGLEFLGCGDVDHSKPIPPPSPGFLEYPTAPRLGVPPLAPANCDAPALVETVLDPPPNGSQSYPPGVYTKLTWNLGSVTSTKTINYVAGIPLKENTTSFSPPPDPLVPGDEGSNLNNNNGSSTREGASESSLTNYARASGTYQGPTVGPAAVQAAATETVSIEDLRMRKSVSPTIFNSTPGSDIATYTIKVDSSEYVTADNIVITDIVPDGLCPLQMGAPCDTGGGSPPSHAVDSISGSGNGPYTIVFDPLALGNNGTVSVTFDARMMTTFTDGTPTVAGDTFTNQVSLTGDTTPIPGTGETGTQAVTDNSSATQRTLGSSIEKTMKSRVDSSGDCALNLGQYSTPPPVDTFRKGDRVCFKLRVDFPDDVRTRKAVVQDFLPPGTEYIAGSYAATAANTAPIDSFSGAGAPLSWTLGTDTLGTLYVPEGAVFEVTLAARVLNPSPPPVPDVLGNLMKLNTENTPGQVRSMRDRVDLEIAPPPNVLLEKGVYQVDDPASGPFPPNQDGREVRDNSVATFRVDITNGPSDPAAEFDVRDIQTFDVLPPGVVCADISNYKYDRTTNPSGPLSPASFAPPGSLSDYVNCYNPADSGFPTINPLYGTATQSVIAWRLPTGATGDRFVLSASPAQTLTLLYDMAIPDGLSVGTRLDNSAGVRSFTSATNDASAPSASNYPADNIDALVLPAQQDAAAADDDSWVYLPDATLGKTVTSSIVEQNNNANAVNKLSAQATIGEDVTFTVSARVPAHTTVYNGVLADALPTNLTFQSASATYSATDVDPAPDPLPGGFSFNSGNGTLTFPDTWTNSSSTTQLFQVTITARVANISVGPDRNTQGRTKSNTASFASNATLNGTPLSPVVSNSALVHIVEPLPTLTKTPDTVDPVVGGQTVDYTLVAGNTNGRPPSHRTSVVDCINEYLTYDSIVSNDGGSVVIVLPNIPGNTCAAGKTQLTWDAGTVGLGNTPAPATPGPKTLVYRTTVKAAVAGGITIPNTAVLTGNSLETPNADNRSYTATANASIRTTGSVVVKTVSPNPATIGDTVHYRVEGVLPAGTSYYNLSVIDTLPPGLDPAVTNVAVTCLDSDGNSCVQSPSFTTLNPDLPNRKVGWLLGDYIDYGKSRLVSVTFDTVVQNVGTNFRGATLTNNVAVRWDNQSGQPAPDDVNDSFQNPGRSASRDLTIAEPNVQLAKSVDDTTPAPGDTFTYTIQVTNPAIDTPHPVSTAYDIDVTDCIPADVVVTPGSISSGGLLGSATGPCPGGVITWTDLGPIATDGILSPPLTYDATWVASNLLHSTSRTNTADVPSYFSLPSVPASPQRREYTNTPDSTATVTPSFPRVDAVKTTPGGSLAYIDDAFTWQIELTNNGGTEAFAVDAVDVLPNNWTYVAGSAQVSVPGQPTVQINPTVSPVVGPPLVQTLTWTNLGDLAADNTKHIVITFQATPTPAVTTSPGVGHSVAHTNTVTPAADDATGAPCHAGPNPGDCLSYSGGPATADAYVDSADLELTKTHTPATWIAGQQGTWKVAVKNNGPNASVGPFVVTDTLPASGLTFVSAGGGSGGAAWACTQPSPTTIECRNTNSGNPLASGASLPDIDVVMAVPSGTLQGTQFTNTATVTGETYDPVPGNNTDPDQVTVAAQADLKITKTTTTNPVVAGQPVTYSLVVDNINGPSVSQPNITVADTLPASLSNASASGTDWACTVTGQDISCVRNQALTVGQIAPAIIVTADLASGTTGNLVNTAVVTPTTTDPVPGNNTSTVTDPIGPKADLVMTKEANGQLTPGDAGSYTMTVQNLGPSDAAPSVRITDTLPTGLTYTGFEDVTGTWGCSASGQDVTCVLGGGTPTSLAAGATRKVKVKIDIAPGLDPAVPIVNTACVASPTTDPVPGNNCSTTSTGPVREVDLAIEKNMPANVVAGNQMALTLDVRNNGPSNSGQPIVVSDTLPAQFEYVSADGGPTWNCDYQAGARELTCRRITGLAKNASAPTITVTVQVKPDAGPATIPNTATVTGPDHDPVPANNTSTDQVLVSVMTDLILTKTTQNPTTVRAGQNATFTIGVTNSGPSTAVNVSVTDTLPAGMTLVSATGTGWDCTALVCSRNSLAPGAGPDITVVARVSPSVSDGNNLRNSATVVTSSPESDYSNNTDHADVDVVAEADLGLTKTHAGSDFRAGEQVTYTVAVRNHGPSDAQAPIRIVDQLPVGMTYVSYTGAWSCAADPVDTSGQKVTCTLPGVTALAADADAPDLVMITLIDADQGAGDLTNEARVTSATTEPVPDPHPNNDSDTVTIDRRADLAVVKSHAGTAVVGQTVPFTLQVTNNGPSTAKNAVVTDTFPTGLEPKSASGTDWNCDIAGQKVTCTKPGTLKVGVAEPITVVADVKASAYPKVENTAKVDSDTTDPKPDNNISTDPVEIPPRVDLAVTKTHTGTWKVGQEKDFTVVVSNNGPTPDPGPITVTDTLPSGLEYVSMTGNGYQCSADGQKVTCTGAGPLDVGGKVTFTLRVRVLKAAYPSAENTVSVTSPAIDVNPDNNTAKDRVDVDASFRITGSKEAIENTDDTIVWRVTVKNDGPSDSVDPITVVDSLPSSLRYESFDGEGWDCSADGRVVTCTHEASLAAGAQTHVDLTTGVVGSDSKITNNVVINPGSGGKDVPASGTVERPSGGGGDDGGGGDTPARTGAALAEMLLWALLLTGVGFGLVGFAGRRGRRRS